MKKTTTATFLAAVLLVGYALNEYSTFEGKDNVLDGTGGTKVVVDGMEIWDNGEPPRQYKGLALLVMCVRAVLLRWHCPEIISVSAISQFRSY